MKRAQGRKQKGEGGERGKNLKREESKTNYIIKLLDFGRLKGKAINGF